MQQFRRIGLYPSLNPPTVSLGGGLIHPGQTLLMGSPVGKVLYTLDGTDPRVQKIKFSSPMLYIFVIFNYTGCGNVILNF